MGVVLFAYGLLFVVFVLFVCCCFFYLLIN